MKYIVLLRGINVGGHRKVEMKRLKGTLQSLEYTNVETYLNSGNAIFDSNDDRNKIEKEINKALEEEFGFVIPTLLKSKEEMKVITAAVPEEWQNNKEYKTDVAYLFPIVDSQDSVEKVPVKREYADIFYVKGAIVWHILKKDLSKSQLNKLVGQDLYKFMTVRNINTARFLSED